MAAPTPVEFSGIEIIRVPSESYRFSSFPLGILPLGKVVDVTVNVAVLTVKLPLFVITIGSMRSWSKKIKLQNLLITLLLAVFSVLTRGKMFLRAETSWGKIFFRPYLFKNSSFNGAAAGQVTFFLCFCRALAACRSVLPSRFQRAESLRDTNGLLLRGASNALFTAFLLFCTLSFAFSVFQFNRDFSVLNRQLHF